ncbi:aminoglycoside phosphotransferase [Novosphingobium sp. PC22D]|uniref:phosphotransferase family protein n=1 Tax=Novosphingobium sp. PC22D TaxID=1962403 RepID=UPI000BF231F6|nr:phosphotransferase family protein [Novosphingobium sp. PC22D]PEQ10397.1 aminoglycoside phosphotransferase [Novosphingobium sp. PC22D]
MSDVIVAPETRDLDELASLLGGWLETKIEGAHALSIGNLAYPRGAGQSHETILFDAAWTDASGTAREQGCVVRIRPEKFTVFPDTLFEQQYAVMKLLSDEGYVRVARPLWFEADPTVLGKPFFVMEKKQGRVPVSIPPYARSGWLAEATPEQRRVLWREAVEQLAAIQRVPVGKVGFLAGEGGLSGLDQEWDKYCRFVDWLEEVEPQPTLRAGLDRLKSLWPDHRPEGMVWGDARIGNMMFDADFRVVAVMDWEQPSLGGALHDLAWFCVLAETMHGPNAVHGAPLEGMGSHDETVALWEQLCGKSAEGLGWYEDFTHFKMTCTAVRLGHLRGQPMVDEATMRRRLKLD